MVSPVMPPVRGGLRARLRTGIAWNVVAAASTQGAVFVANLTLANLLGRHAFGEYAMLQSTVVTLAAIAQVSTGYTATKYVAEFRRHDPERAGRVLGLCSRLSLLTGSLMATAVALAAPWVSGSILRAPHLDGAMLLVAAAVLFGTVNGYQIGALAGLEAFPALGRAGLVNGLLLLVGVTAGGWIGGVKGAVAGLAVSGALQCLVLRRKLSREVASQGLAMGHVEWRREAAVLTGFALPATLSGFVSLPVVWLSGLWVARQPGGYDQLALLSVAHNFRAMVLFLPLVVNAVSMSVLNSERGAGAEARYRRTFWANLGLTAGAVSAGALSVGALGPWLLAAFGEPFREGFPVLLVLMLAAVPEALGSAVYQATQSEGRLWLSFWAIVLPRDLAVLSLAYLLAPGWGALGVATAHAIAWTAALIGYVAVAWHVRPGCLSSA
jgi:O-antigen/teichoic acid export membrane protein